MVYLEMEFVLVHLGFHNHDLCLEMYCAHCFSSSYFAWSFEYIRSLFRCKSAYPFLWRNHHLPISSTPRQLKPSVSSIFFLTQRISYGDSCIGKEQENNKIKHTFIYEVQETLMVKKTKAGHVQSRSKWHQSG